MTKKTIVVTGGNGFIGSHIAERLLADGHRVVVFDNVPLTEARNLDPVKGHPQLIYVQGDIRDKGALSRVIARGVDQIYHLAAIVGVKNYCEDPFKVIDVNVIGTRNTLELALKDRIPVVLASTSEVYGKNPQVPWQEESDRVLGSTSIDRWSYSTSKALSEHLALGMSKSFALPTTILRYFNVYGPRQTPNHVVSQSIYRVLRDEAPLLYDTGHQTRCFTYIADAVEGTIRAANEPAAMGQSLNIGSNREATVRDVIELIIKISGKQIRAVDFDTQQHYAGQYEDIPRRIPAVDKARELLQWQADTPLEEGIRRTIAWAKESPWWLDRS